MRNVTIEVYCLAMRCSWVPNSDEQYVSYHDDEWGRPVTQAHKIFEKVCLEGFQSGLSWLTILRKRDRFREVFDDFDFIKVAEYGPEKVEDLLSDAGIIRHRGKIEATINNAQRAIELESDEGIVPWFWQYASDTPTIGKIPTQTETSQQLAKALKSKGWKFFGPTTAYAFMQSEGLVNDHHPECISFNECETLRQNVLAKLGRD